MKRLLLCVAVCYLLGFAGFAEAKDPLQLLPSLGSGSNMELPGTKYSAQTQPTSPKPILPADVREMLLLSLSTDDYPVTPGDAYRLMYITADTPIAVDTAVESDFAVNLGFLGKLPAKGLTFLDLKKQVEQRVLRAYPQGLPSMTIVSNGLFQVRVEGEVVQTGYSTAWGLTRLSKIVENYLTPYSSTRDVEIVPKVGEPRRFDLFRALRLGEKEQDPYVRPNDTVVIHRRNRAIQLDGEIRRPGLYQLLPGEGLKELIEYYGDDFTLLADRARVRVDRIVTDRDKIAETMLLDLSGGLDQRIELEDLDTLVVPKKTDYLPVVLIEGAILPDPVQQQTAAVAKSGTLSGEPARYSKLVVSIKDGETLFEVLWDRRDQIYPDADLAHAYLIRRKTGETIPVDLQTLLYSYKPQYDIALKAYDQLIIPFRQFTVVVTGGVRRPGTYPYVPNKSFNYYIDLAGGVDPELGLSSRTRVLDRDGHQLPRESFLDPESKVYVPYSFSYYFFRYFPIIATSAAAIFTALYYFHEVYPQNF